MNARGRIGSVTFYLVVLFFFCVVQLPQITAAEIPHTINYQGVLTDPASGSPLSGLFGMTFSIYSYSNAADCNDPLAVLDLRWSETFPNQDKGEVVVTDGLFSMVLGETNPIDLPFDAQYCLGLKVGTEPEMTPLQPLNTVPYAFTAGNADAVDGRHAVDLDQSAHLAATDNPHEVTAAQLGAANEGHVHPDGAGSGLDADLLDGRDSTDFTLGSDFTIHEENAAAHHARYDDTEVVAAILAADGSESGLDSDLLDGSDSTDFAAATHSHANDDLPIPLVLEDSLAHDAVIRGANTNADGVGVFGESAGVFTFDEGGAAITVGAGVWGYATATTGGTAGVVGESDSDSGAGVVGLAQHDSGNNSGVYGETDSPNGAGVKGENTNTMTTGLLAGGNAGASGQYADGPSGYLGGSQYGVYGSDGDGLASAGTHAGYFDGDVHVTGGLAVEGELSGKGSGLTDLDFNNIATNVPDGLADGDDDTTDHTALSNIGTNTHAQIDSHLGDAVKHRSINDSGTGATEVWSASKINTELAGKSGTGHGHAGAYAPIGEGVTNGNAHDHSGGDGNQVDHDALSNNGGAGSHAAIATHLGDAAVHRVINDSGSGATDLWSGAKISTELGTKSVNGHAHDSRYYLKGELDTSGGGGSVHWDNLAGVPAGFADGVDDDNVLSESTVEDYIVNDGSTGMVPFNDGSKLVDTNIFFDGANVGIGTETPGSALEVSNGEDSFGVELGASVVLLGDPADDEYRIVGSDGISAAPNGTGVTVQAGNGEGASTGSGGSVAIRAGDGGGYLGESAGAGGGDVTITGGNASGGGDNDGGDINLNPGYQTGAGALGKVMVNGDLDVSDTLTAALFSGDGSSLTGVVAANGVTGGDSHTHSSGDGGQVAHSNLNLDDGTNPHGTTKADVNLGNVENTALSTWSGSANITTVGVIGSGKWGGTTIAPTYGGTGLTGGYSNGELLIGNGLGLTAATLTPGTGISITNGSGSIAVATDDSAINHDSLANFAANEHIDWTVNTGGTMINSNNYTDNDSLAGLSCSTGQVAKYTVGTGWSCEADAGITSVNRNSTLVGDGAATSLGVAVPLSLSGSDSTGIIRGTNNHATLGYAVSGNNSSTSTFGGLGGIDFGVYGNANSSGDKGVEGRAAGSASFGVYGQTFNSSGVGVYGIDSTGSGNFGYLGGNTYAVYSQGNAHVAGNLTVTGDITGTLKKQYGKQVVVAKSGGDYTSPVTAMNNASVGDTWCGTPSATNPCLVRIMPGEYNLGTASLQMVDWINIEGSGAYSTVLVGTPAAGGVVNGADNAFLQFLTVKSTGGANALAINNNGVSPYVRFVRAWALNGSSSNTAVYNNSNAADFQICAAIAEGGPERIGFYNDNASAKLRDVRVYIRPGGSTDGYGIKNDGGSPNLWGLSVQVDGGGSGNLAVGIYNDLGTSVSINDTVVNVYNGQSNFGVYNTGNASPRHINNDVRAAGGSDSIGIYNGTGKQTFNNLIVVAEGGTNFNVGMQTIGGAVDVLNADILGTDGSTAVGAWNESLSGASIYRSVVLGAENANDNNAVFNKTLSGGSGVEISGAKIDASGGLSANKGVYSENAESVTISNSVIRAKGSGSSTNYGMLNVTVSGGTTTYPRVSDSNIYVSGGDYAIGVKNQDASARFRSVLISAENAAMESVGLQLRDTALALAGLETIVTHSEVNGGTNAVNLNLQNSTTPETSLAYTWLQNSSNSEIGVTSGSAEITNCAHVTKSDLADMNSCKPPTLTIQEPSSTVTVGICAGYDIVYTLQDSDNTVSVDLYYDTDNSGFDGTLLAACTYLPQGSGMTCNIPYTSYPTPYNTPFYIYGVTSDGSTTVRVYSTGTVTFPVPAC